MDPQPGSFWEAIRTWAEASGLLVPTATADAGDPTAGRLPPHVPESVCAACPICQAAATLEQVNPQVLADLTAVGRSVLSGIGAALATAAEHRTSQAAGASSGPGAGASPTTQADPTGSGTEASGGVSA